mgnify:CR=1 FL=1
MDLGRDDLRRPRAALPALPGARALRRGEDGNAGALSGQVAPRRARPARQRLARAALARPGLAACSGRRAGVWAGLWSLPEFDSTPRSQAATAGWPGRGEALPAFVHVLTHFDWHLQPLRWTLPARDAGAQRRAPARRAWPEGRWFADRRGPGARPAGAAAQAPRVRLRLALAAGALQCGVCRTRISESTMSSRASGSRAQQPVLGVDRQRQDLAPAVRHPAGVVEAMRCRGTARRPAPTASRPRRRRLLTTLACVADGATTGSSASGAGVAEPEAVGLLPVAPSREALPCRGSAPAGCSPPALSTSISSASVPTSNSATGCAGDARASLPERSATTPNGACSRMQRAIRSR